MRLLLAAATFARLAGCTGSDQASPDSAVDRGVEADGAASDPLPAAQSDPVSSPARQEASIEGRYRAVMPFGEPADEEGGVTPLQVAGWREVSVTLDASIEVDLVLQPPGCSATTDACSLGFSPPDDQASGTWDLAAMEAGEWTVVVGADPDDYSFVDGVYEVRFTYLSA